MTQDDLGPILIYLFVYGGPIAFLLWRGWNLRRNRQAVSQGSDLPAIAEILSGEVARDPSFSGPFVRFVTEGTRSYFHQRMLNATQSIVITVLECKVGFPGFLQATTTRGIRHPMRSTRFQTLPRSGGFDIVSTDLKWATQTLESGLQDILADLRKTTGRGSRIQLTGDRFLLEVEDRISATEVAQLLPLMNRLRALVRQVPNTTGIVFEGDITLVDQGRCPVCSQEFPEPGLRCAQCRAPHHADCWAYWGRCAIFGCGGSRAA